MTGLDVVFLVLVALVGVAVLRPIVRRLRALEVQAEIDGYADQVCDEMEASKAEAEEVFRADMDRRRELNRTLKEGMAHETIRQRLFEAVQLYELPAEREGGADQ